MSETIPVWLLVVLGVVVGAVVLVCAWVGAMALAMRGKIRCAATGEPSAQQEEGTDGR